MGKISDELKDQAKKKAKKLAKKILIKIAPYLLGFLVILCISSALFGIFNAVAQKFTEIASNIGNFVATTWKWITDDYWIDIGEEITLEVEEGEEKTQTLIDHYMEQMEKLGVSLEDLRLLGEADYNNPDLLNDPASKVLVQKYLAEFVRADLISQEIHRRRGSSLVNPNNEFEVDGGVYLYRTKKEDEEGVASVNNNTIYRMEYKEYDEFMKEQENPSYSDAEKIFTIDKDTNELLYYKVDKVQTITSTFGSIKMEDTQITLEIQREDYRSLIQKYVMPYEFLVNLCMITQNPEFVYHVACLARNTNIQLMIQDNLVITTTEEITTAKMETYKKQIDPKPEAGKESESFVSSKEDEEIEYKKTIETTDTPQLCVAKVNTWSYGMLNKYTNAIYTEEAEEGPISQPNVTNEGVTYTENVIKPGEYTMPQKYTYQIIYKMTDCKKMINISIVRNEYRPAVIVDETKKSKQFLGLLRNDTGECVDEQDIENCVENAVFNRNGYNVKYTIPNSTKEEMPIHKLQSGEQMLYKLLEMRTSNTQDLSTYNQKMQGLKEYMQYIMTFPENEWFDLDNDELDDLLESDDYDNATYGIFWWPLDPNVECRITSYFENREAPTEGASTDHEAIDIAVVTGSNVLASADGVVEFAGGNPTKGYGYYIIIDHQNGFKTKYAHNSQLLVKTGDIVTRGQVIAKSGSTGTSTGPHLHFEIILNGEKVNPLDYVSMSNKQPSYPIYNLTNDQKLDVIYAVVAQECANSYEGALAVITCVLNRCESQAWQNYGGNDPYAQITYSGQFAYSTSVDANQNYKKYLGGKAPIHVKNAVNDALNKGIRNHNYTRFRTATDEYKKKYPNGQDIGGNWYF